VPPRLQQNPNLFDLDLDAEQLNGVLVSERRLSL
jgi:hypothetical protein